MRSLIVSCAPQWGTVDAEIEVQSVENPERKGSPSKACSTSVYYVTHIARDFFLANLYPPGSFTCIFSKTPPEFSLCSGVVWILKFTLKDREIKAKKITFVLIKIDKQINLVHSANTQI